MYFNMESAHIDLACMPVLITDAQNCHLNAYAGAPSNTSNAILDPCIAYIYIYHVFVGNKGSGKSAHMLRFVSALASRQCDLLQILTCWSVCFNHGDLLKYQTVTYVYTCMS